MPSFFHNNPTNQPHVVASFWKILLCHTASSFHNNPTNQPKVSRHSSTITRQANPKLSRHSGRFCSETTAHQQQQLNPKFPQWRTADADIKVFSANDPELSKVLPMKPEVGQNTATHTSPTAKNFSFFNFYSPGPFNFFFLSFFSLSLISLPSFSLRQESLTQVPAWTRRIK